MNKYQEAFNHIVDYGVEVEYFNKQADKPEEESTIMIVSKALDKLETCIELLEKATPKKVEERRILKMGKRYITVDGFDDTLHLLNFKKLKEQAIRLLLLDITQLANNNFYETALERIDLLNDTLRADEDDGDIVILMRVLNDYEYAVFGEIGE